MRAAIAWISVVAVTSACAGGRDGSSTAASTSSTTADSTSESSSSSAAETGTSTTTGDDMAIAAACDCVGEKANPDFPLGPGCGEDLCPQATDTLTSQGCVLEALRDRTPGIVRWYREGTSGYLLIAGGGDFGVLRTAKQQPLCTEYSDATIAGLKDADVYAACLAGDDPAARLACIAEGFVAGEVCGEGFAFPGECL